MAYRNLTKKLVFFGSHDALQEFRRPDFLDKLFFIHCTMREELRTIIMTHNNVNCEMDIFLPETAVDLIGYYNGTSQLRKQFFLYCDTDTSVAIYENTIQPNMCEIFNVNEIEEQLYNRAVMHLVHSLNVLKKCGPQENEDAYDRLVVIGELFSQCADTINEYIRQRSSLPTQPMEQEEE